MTLSAHQPEYLPYLGFFYKMMQCDRFVIVDHVQFQKEGFQNRNYLRSPDDEVLLTVPIVDAGRRFPRICEVEIENRRPWAQKHWKTIRQNYHRSPYFKDHGSFFEDLYSKRWDLLSDLNVTIIRYVMQNLGIDLELDFSTRYDIVGQKTDMIIDLCRKLGADGFVSGWGGKNYVILDEFRRHGLHHRFVKLNHPEYPQQGQPFIPNLSAVDLLFNCGPDSKRILESAGARSTVEQI